MLNYECKVENKGPIRRELTISVKPESIQEAIDKQLNQLRKTAKIKGFREGKVPLELIKRYYMSDVKSDVFSRVIRESYVRALDDNKIVAVGSPEIETKDGNELKEGQSLTFVAKVEVFPDVEVKDLSKIKLTRKSTKITDADIEKSIDNLRENHSEMQPDENAKGPVKTGSFVDVSFQGTVDGEALDMLKSENRLVEVGAKSFMEELENNLIGMKKGETKEFDLPFPADFSEQKLAGKTAKFSVTVHEFKKKKLPEVTDEFAKLFKFETVAELKTKVTESLKEDRERTSRDELKENLMVELCKANKFEVPTGLVQSQLEYLVKENVEFLKRQGFTEKMVRDYLEKNQEQLKGRAEEQVRASLILDKVAQDQKIAVDAKDLDHEYATVAARVNMSPEQVKGMYSQDENAVRQLRYRLKEERATDYILGQVKITEEKGA